MSITGVSITKSTSFRGVAQEFGNTYYYQTPLPISESTALALIDAVVALEKPMHGGTVTFVRAKAWSAGGTKAENQMIAQKNLTGTGTNSASATDPSRLDKERAFLVRIRAGNDSRGRPVFLRKWWHLDIVTIASFGISDQMIRNTAPLITAQRDQLVSWMDSFKHVIANATGFDLVSDKGRAITGETQAHQYLEHHQLGDMWRG